MTEPLLEVANLSVRYGGASEALVLDRVTFSIRKGETLGVVGESGSGKSTIALALLRLLPQNAAFAAERIGFSDEDILSMPPQRLRDLRGSRIGIVFQDPMTSLNPSWSIGQQLIETIQFHQEVAPAEAERSAIELLAAVKIPRPDTFMSLYPHQLSGGMRQRVLIALALACRPQLLILDEPTTALDVTTEAAILDLLESLKAQYGLTMLYITHDLGVVSRMSDRVAVLYAGRLVELRQTKAIFEQPLHPYTKGLIASIPTLQARKKRHLAAIDGQIPPNGATIPGCNFITRCPFACAGCSEEQTLENCDGEGGQVRCWRAEQVRERGWPAPVDATSMPEWAPGAPDDAVLRVRDLSKQFYTGRARWFGIGNREEPIRAVKGVSFDIRQGETLGLVGESGSGKTTLGRLVIGLLTPSDGSIEIDGKLRSNIGRLSMEERKKLQMVFQNTDSSLNPRLKVGEIVGRPLKLFGMVGGSLAAEVTKLLELVRLERSYIDKYPHQLSGGERQRVGIARALSIKPKVLVLDEPVSALDVSVQASVINILIDLQRELGLAYLFISHNLAVVRAIADTIAVMHRGEFVEFGPADQIFAAPQHPYTRSLLAAVPTLNRGEDVFAQPDLMNGYADPASCGIPHHLAVGCESASLNGRSRAF